jgi:NADPH:quinone reductase
MQAFQVTSHDTPPAWRSVADPAPGPGQALIRVAATGLNFADLLMAGGTYQDMPPLPLTLGLELAGTVEALGPGTDGPAPGTRVAALPGSGGLAEFAVVAADRLIPIPDTMPFDVAAGFQIAYGTSHIALVQRARLVPGETLLVLGAAGGVGLTAVEIGALAGARVIAVARGAERLAIAQAAGAHHLIDSDAGDLRDKVRALGGADVVYDPVGGASFDAALRCLKPLGRMIVIGFASGEVPQIRANHLLVKNIEVIGVYFGGYSGFRPDLLSDSLSTLIGWHSDGRLHPRISHVLPRDQAQRGLDMLKDRTATGKIVVALR